MQRCRHAPTLGRALCAAALAAASHGEPAAVMRGVSYGPVPLRSQAGASELPQDDWMCGEAVPMWGRAGRGDLRIMRLLGANVVRLYGNNADNDHTNFLDEAHIEGLGVLPGMSDYPFYQQVPGNCRDSTDYDCFSQIKPLYLLNLQKGFLAMDKTYHPALRVMNILNEPDLKMPADATGSDGGPAKMSRAIVSAFDAMLEAEKEAGVTGPLINFTATFSYAICAACTRFSGKPALGQIAQLDDAMHNPEKYNYTPRNNITAAYKARFIHSFNTQNPATDLQTQFLDEYNAAFPNMPVYIGEYHRVGANQTEDVSMILHIADQNPLFMGISFFEYQVAYWKSGSELEFGLMGLGNETLADMPYFGKVYSVYCLDPMPCPPSGMLMVDAVARVYGGPGVDTATLCTANPYGAPLRDSGFAAISGQGSVSQMAKYVESAIRHMGATVADASGLEAFAQRFVGEPGTSFRLMMAELGGRPAWASFDPSAKCVASRDVDPTTVGSAISWACQQAAAPNCSNIPEPCHRSAYTIADYVFSRYFEASGNSADPLQGCYFGSAAMLAASEIYTRWTGAAECVAGGGPVPAPPTAAPPTPAPSPAPAPVPSPTTEPGPSPAPATPTPAPTEAPAMTSAPSPQPEPVEDSAAARLLAPAAGLVPLLAAAALLATAQATQTG
mmetsp:Transcript_120290/g.335622  ORF Transcript_120290/g.335622 Transcript_120290/m.335622 type:complete len:672 (-) Transcript_120290:79-2094(-)